MVGITEADTDIFLNAIIDSINQCWLLRGVLSMQIAGGSGATKALNKQTYGTLTKQPRSSASFSLRAGSRYCHKSQFLIEYYFVNLFTEKRASGD